MMIATPGINSAGAIPYRDSNQRVKPSWMIRVSVFTARSTREKNAVLAAASGYRRRTIEACSL